MALDLLAEKLGAGRLVKSKHKATYAICTFDGKGVLLMKPQTYMNLSGEAVRDMAKSYNVPAERIIVIFDDIATPSGKLRVKRSGSDGGHNGIKSIIYQLSSDAFPRIKIGVGDPEEADMKEYVLDHLSTDAYQAVKAAPDAAITMLRFGVDQAMQDFNGKSFV